jgi:hypothetical protein
LFCRYCLLGIVGAHVIATRLVPDVLFPDSFPFEKSGLLADSMSGVAKLFFVPYYITLACSGLIHTSIGLWHSRRILLPSISDSPGRRLNDDEQTYQQQSTPSRAFGGALLLGCVLMTTSVLCIASPSFNVHNNTTTTSALLSQAKEQASVAVDRFSSFIGRLRT